MLWRMLRVNARFQQAFQQLGLTSCESVVRHFAGNETPVSAVMVRPTTLKLPDNSTLEVFYKQYEFSAPAWKFIGRASKARREFDNYEVFTRLGIPAAEAIACGEERDAIGRLRRAFILTRAIPNALNLKEFFERHCANRAQLASRKMRLQLLCQLAGMTQKIHAANFFHHDLVWRNILATETPPAEPQLWWIDCPRGQFDRWSPLRHRRRLKDLASLDKVASQLCTAGERLHFIKLYLGKQRLDAEARKLVRDALEYRRRRWPADWQ
jgi:Lipopolysaccharide kinase (Kdo/WaaP) family